jgi:hypothetical protein
MKVSEKLLKTMFGLNIITIPFIIVFGVLLGINPSSIFISIASFSGFYWGTFVIIISIINRKEDC